MCVLAALPLAGDTGPPRVSVVYFSDKKTAFMAVILFCHWEWVFSVMFSGLNRPGSDLLFRALRRSTIGVTWFHFRVRDGTGWGTSAMTTKSIKSRGFFLCLITVFLCSGDQLI